MIVRFPSAAHVFRRRSVALQAPWRPCTRGFMHAAHQAD